MRTKARKTSRLAKVLLDTADDMHRSRILDSRIHAKITLRHLGPAKSAGTKALSGDEIRALRERAHMSQAVFARHLNVTTGYISQLERGVKRPAGAALALLDVIRRKGMDAIL